MTLVELTKTRDQLLTENRRLKGLPPSAENLAAPERRQMIDFGKKYESGTYRNVADIAKDVRADLKAALAAGYFPAGTKFSVTIQRYSMGQSISLTIKSLPGVPLMQHVSDEYGPRHAPTPAAAEYVKRADEILQAYNYNNSDSMTDYYDVNFAGHADLDWELRRQAEEAL